jgi:signal transduction histidine kinase
MPRRPSTQGPNGAHGLPDRGSDERAAVRSLLAETQALSARLAALNEVAVAVQASLDLDSALSAMAREARWVLDFQYCSVAELLDDSYLERVLKSPDAAAPATRSEPRSSGPIGTAAGSGYALLLRSAAEIGEAFPGMQSGLIVPLRAQGQVIGTLNFFSDRPDHYSFNDLRVTSSLAAQTAMAVQNTRLFREIAEARDLLHTTLEAIGDGVVMLDGSARIRVINSAARRLLNLGDGPLAGRRFLWVAARARGAGRYLIGREALYGALASFSELGGARLALVDGRHLEWAAVPLGGDAGSPGMVLTLRDVSDRVALEELRDDMIGMLVHDLRTPLTGLILGLDLLPQLHPAPPGSDGAELITRASESARQLLRQVNTLLDVRKLEAGRLELYLDQHPVAMLVASAARRLSMLAQVGGQRLEVQLPPALPAVKADHGLIERVMENLIGNAIKFTPAGGRIGVGARALDGVVEITVEDTGPGVPPAMRQQIFEKYGQAHRSGERRGTGLGLAFCKLAVEAHGGQIGLRDNPGGGSVFWLTLPAAGEWE